MTLLPYFHVAAGFPSPAADYIEPPIDLNQLLVRCPAATVLCRVSGDSMSKDGISDGDIVIVDKSIAPAHGKIAVVTYQGELMLKRIHVGRGSLMLLSSNPAYPAIELFEGDDLTVWGIVAYVIKKC